MAELKRERQRLQEEERRRRDESAVLEAEASSGGFESTQIPFTLPDTVFRVRLFPSLSNSIQQLRLCCPGQIRVLDNRDLLARQERARRIALAESRREAVAEAEATAARAAKTADGLEEEAKKHEQAAAEARRRCEELQRRAVAALQEKVRSA